VAHRDHVTEHFDPERGQQGFCQRAHRHPRRGFARAGTFQDVPCIVEIVLDGACQVRMAGPRAGHRLAVLFSPGNVFHRQSLRPVLPVPVADQQRHGRADGVRMAYSRNDLHLVGFDFHPTAAAVALLPPPQLVVNRCQGYGYSGRQSGQRCHQAFAVGLPRGLKTQHSTRISILANSNNSLPLCVLRRDGETPMIKFALWLILFVLCWPLALAALVLYPLVWLLLLPFRVVGIAVGGALSLVWAIVTLPARLLRAI
jgi:hypothetical protein